MKKKIIFLIIIFVLILKTQLALAGVSFYFDFKEGQVSQTYIDFTYHIGSQFYQLIKDYHFKKDHCIQVLESLEKKKGLVIKVLINEEKTPFIQVKVKDLKSEKIIEEKAKEFSHKIFEKLKELDKE